MTDILIMIILARAYQLRRAGLREKPTCHCDEPYLHIVSKSFAGPRRLRRQRGNDPGLLRLWPMLIALPAAFVATVLGLAGLTWTVRAVLDYPAVPHPKSISLHDWIGVLQLVFASVAGAGALVALIVAYRRQRVAEADSARDRTRVFNERFIAIAAQIGNDKAAVRLAGVHAMAGLADDWEKNRQTCVDALCAYLRMPYEPDPGTGAPSAERLAFGANREVRHTVVRVIAAHLQPKASVSWQGLDLDFTGVHFDGGDFGGARFSGGMISFASAVFCGNMINFVVTEFSGAVVSFADASFSGGLVQFGGAVFSDGAVHFSGASFSGGMARFASASFSGGIVDFTAAKFSSGKVRFAGASFSRGTVSFRRAELSGGTVDFNDAVFSSGSVDFGGAKFSGGTVDFGVPADWSCPPMFNFTGTPPPGVRLP